MHCNGQVDKIVPNGLGSIPFQNTVPGMRRKISSKVLCSISKRNTVSIFFLQDIFISAQRYGRFNFDKYFINRGWSTNFGAQSLIHFLLRYFAKADF